MLNVLMWVFIIMSIVMIPTFYIYESQQSLIGTYNYNAAKYTLGNMGYSGTQCMSQYTQLNLGFTMACETGKITTLNSYGLIPNNHTDYLKNDPDAYAYAYCGASSTSSVAQVDTCTSTFLNSALLTTDFNVLCASNKSC
jgi:hypothetical protein